MDAVAEGCTDSAQTGALELPLAHQELSRDRIRSGEMLVTFVAGSEQIAGFTRETGPSLSSVWLALSRRKRRKKGRKERLFEGTRDAIAIEVRAAAAL